MSVNYDRVCRLCLSSRGEILPIFPTTTSSDDPEPPVLASKIKDCVSVQITENDDLPTNVCRKCLDNVNNWHTFKTVCERTQKKLQSLINKDGSLLEEVKIKSEPLSDEAYDDGVHIDGSYPDSEFQNAGPSAKLQPEGPPILASLGLTPRSDKKCVDPRMDWHRVHAIMDMVQQDEVIDSLQSTEECDLIQQSDHDSDTDAELLEIDDIDTIDSFALSDTRKTISKNPKISLSANTKKIQESLKLRKQQITKQHKYCPKPKNAWQMLFTDDLLEVIVSATNKKITQQYKNSVSSTTNVGEIKMLIGILYFHGIMRPTHQKCIDLWHNEYGITCIKSAMRHERFQFLLGNLSFFDGDYNLQYDTMKLIRKVFDIFTINCREAYNAHDVMVIDEILVPVYGPCPFRYNIKKKPLENGIKIALLLDPITFYVSNLQMATDQCFEAEQIVTNLIQHLTGSGRTVVMDSWYSSLSLIYKLKNEHQLYTITALKPCSEFIPPLFLSNCRKCRTFMTGFLDDDISLTSYVNSQSKAINIVTNEPKFYKKGHTTNTTPVSVYKQNQSAVEVVDVLMHYYSTMQNTNDWTVSLFFTMLNVASINAQVIWSSHNSQNIAQRRLFIKELALSLLKLNDCEEILDSPRLKKIRLNDDELVNTFEKRRRCRICVKTAKRDRRSKNMCMKCGQCACFEHIVQIKICTMCK